MQKRGKNPATPSVKVHTAPAQKLLIRQELPDAKAKTGRLSKNSALQNSCAFVPLQRKTQYLRQNLIAKAAKAETGKLSKNSALQNSCAFVPLQRKTQCLRQNRVAKVLWHIKSRYLPNAVSQSPRIQLWHLKKTDLPNAVSQSPEFSLR